MGKRIFLFHAKKLLSYYGYVHYIVMSDPRLVCDFPFSPYNDNSIPEPDFCKDNCCLMLLEWFEKIYKYRWKGVVYTDCLICCHKNKNYISGLRKLDGRNEEIQYKSNKDIKLEDIKKQRKLIVTFFWLFAYIYLGSQKRDELETIFNSTDPKNPLFKKLLIKFSSIESLCGMESNAELIYNNIRGYESTKTANHHQGSDFRG